MPKLLSVLQSTRRFWMVNIHSVTQRRVSEHFAHNASTAFTGRNKSVYMTENGSMRRMKLHHWPTSTKENLQKNKIHEKIILHTIKAKYKITRMALNRWHTSAKAQQSPSVITFLKTPWLTMFKTVILKKKWIPQSTTWSESKTKFKLQFD